MSLTKAQLLDKCKCRFAWVEVEGFGTVGVRSCPEVQASRRQVSYVDSKGQPIVEEQAKANLHMLIDQIMQDEKTPMFTDEDIETLSQCDTEGLNYLYKAIAAFNGNGKKKEKEE